MSDEGGKLNDRQGINFIKFVISQSNLLPQATFICPLCGKKRVGKTDEHEGWCTATYPKGRKATAEKIRLWHQHCTAALRNATREVKEHGDIIRAESGEEGRWKMGGGGDGGSEAG